MQGTKISPTEMGTPQGGVISPLLCNIALNGLEQVAKESVGTSAYQRKLGSRPKVHTTRYADDFIITSVNEELLLREVCPAVEEFLAKRNLKLKEAKTRILHVSQGVDFLGFNLRRHTYRPELNKTTRNPEKHNQVLIIRPSKKNVIKLVEKIKSTMLPARPMESIIRDLNPILRGWAEYFRISYHSLRVMGKLSHYIWTKTWIWARKRHSKRNAEWVYNKYIQSSVERKWRIGVSAQEILYDMSTVTSLKLTPLRENVNPYTEEGEKYYEKRRKDMVVANFRKAIYQKYKYKCPHCGDSLFGEESVELHHVIPASRGGKWTLDNIQPLHQTCHASVTYGLKDK